MKQQLLTLAVAALLALPAISIAEEKPAENKPAGERGERRGAGRFGSAEDRLKWMTEKLSLTQEQQDKVKAIYAKSEDKFKAAREKGYQQLSEDERKELGELRRAQMEEVAGVLTPEQKEKMKELAPQGRRGRGDGAGGGAKPGEKPAGQ